MEWASTKEPYDLTRLRRATGIRPGRLGSLLSGDSFPSAVEMLAIEAATGITFYDWFNSPSGARELAAYRARHISSFVSPSTFAIHTRHQGRLLRAALVEEPERQTIEEKARIRHELMVAMYRPPRVHFERKNSIAYVDGRDYVQELRERFGLSTNDEKQVHPHHSK